jgi:hypothetical protein
VETQLVEMVSVVVPVVPSLAGSLERLESRRGYNCGTNDRTMLCLLDKIAKPANQG